MKKEIVYIGTSQTIISKIITSDFFELTHVLCEEKRLNKDYIKTVNKFNLTLIKFQNKVDFINIIQKFSKKTIFLIYQFDFIVPKTLTENYSFFNLHAGNINKNRGAHPIIWSVLKGDKETFFSLHKINHMIDQGILIYEYKILINEKDSPKRIKENMEKGFSKIFKYLNLFLNKKIRGKVINGGVYNPFISEEDYTINLDKDTEKIIKNKIRSQKEYKGAVFFYNEKKYYLKSYSEINKIISS